MKENFEKIKKFIPANYNLLKARSQSDDIIDISLVKLPFVESEASLVYSSDKPISRILSKNIFLINEKI